MKWVYFLAKKFKGSRQKRGVRLVWNLALIGVAIGVGTLLVTQSVLTGYEKVIRKSVMGFNAHLVVLKAIQKPSGESEEKSIEERYPGEILGATPFLYREGLLVSKGKVKGAVVKGIDPLTFESVYDVKVRPLGDGQLVANIEELLSVSGETPAIILGSDLASDLGVDAPGRTIKAFLPKEKEGGAGSTGDNFQSFLVQGIFTSGLHEFDSGFAFVDMKRLQDIYGVPDAATGIEFRLRNPMMAEDMAKDLQRQLGIGYEVVSWQRLNNPLFKALKIERALFFVIMSMVVAVAAFNIVGVLLLLIFEKTREISILRAMGTPYRGLKRLFGLQGLWIGLVGCFWGLVLGGVVAWIIRSTKILQVAKEVYLVGELPVHFSLEVVLMVVGISLLIAYFATQFAVARIKKAPLEF